MTATVLHLPFRPRLVPPPEEPIGLGDRVRHVPSGRIGSVTGVGTIPPSTRPLVVTVRWDDTLPFVSVTPAEIVRVG